MTCEHHGTAPYSDGDTSREAALAIQVHLPRLERVVLYAIAEGRTADEVERETGLSHQTVSARIRGLVQRGLLEDSGARRPTRSGRNAAVWTVRPAEPEQAVMLL